MTAPACAAPVTSLYLDPVGDVHACCQNTWLRLGNIGARSLSSIWTGPDVERLRRATAAGDLGLGCERCEVHVRAGRDEAAFARVYDHLQPDPVWPVQLELALSSACNLQCTMCNGELSSAIRIHREGRPPAARPYGDEFFEDLDLFLPHLASLVVLGGEPFLGAESLRVLDRLIELGLTPRCSITTNGTVWGRRVERILESLPCHITVSLDALSPEVFESIRVGARAVEVFANVERFRSALARHGGSISVAFTLLRANWSEMAPLMAWCDERGLRVFVNTVTHPPDQSLLYAPDEELAAVVEGLERDAAQFDARLGANRDAFLAQLHDLRLVRDRRGAEVPVEIAVADRAQTTTTVARVEISAGPDQLIESIEGSEAGRFGLAPDVLVGQPIWAAQRAMSMALGTLVQTRLDRNADGSEDFTASFERDGCREVLEARLVPRSDGQQVWEARLEADPG